jgi:hypothetical protein
MQPIEVEEEVLVEEVWRTIELALFYLKKYGMFYV